MSAATTMPIGRDGASAAFIGRADTVRCLVDAELARVLTRRLADIRVDPNVAVVVGAVARLALRGGKRVRAALVSAAYDACGGEGGIVPVLPAGAAVELLQAYLLAHDDWMDGDALRRGGPSVHVAVGSAFGSARLGEVGAVLGGDYACAMAQEVLLGTESGSTHAAIPPARVLAAARALARMQERVVRGQILDVTSGASAGEAQLRRMHELKTGSYTVEGPLDLGAELAGASPAQRAVLRRFAAPLGLAFQLRDDLLGVFGDPSKTGKPVGADLTRGAMTAVVVEARGDQVLHRLMARVLGRRDARPADVASVIEALHDRGVVRRLEARIREHVREAQDALIESPLTPDGRLLLLGAAYALGAREH
jgi:geranylgeranyl diphosphate synthase type I